MSPFEIGNCDRAKTFLASGVPNLEFHLRVIQVQVLDFKVDADCRDERRRKAVICIPHEQARFTDTCVSKHQKFNVDIVRMLAAPGRWFRNFSGHKDRYLIIYVNLRVQYL